MPDTSKPVLKKITLPTTVDLAGGAQAATILVEADDGPDGSGVAEVTLQFDHELVQLGAMPYGYGYLTVGGTFSKSLDTFKDGTPNSANEVLLLGPNTSAGTYAVVGATVQDRAGNSTWYSAAELQAAGLGASMTVTGSKADRAGPALLGLQLGEVDLSKGDGVMPIVVTARDNAGGNGVHHAYLKFDKQLDTRFGLTDSMLVGGGSGFTSNGDDFGDASPERASLDAMIGKSTQPGTYNVASLQLIDASGNATMYYAGQLKEMGIATSVVVKGGTVDNTAPVLDGLQLPGVINLKNGDAAATFKAWANDGGGTGVDTVKIWLDGYWSNSGLSTPLVVLGWDGAQADTFHDATPGVASVFKTIDKTSNPGMYDVVSVEVSDKAGNTRVYSNAELKLMNINTRIDVGDGTVRPSATAWVVPAKQGELVTLKLYASTAVANGAEISFDLTSQFLQGSVTEVRMGGQPVFGSYLPDNGGNYTMKQHYQGTATAAQAGSVLATITIELKQGIGDLAYALSDLRIGGQPQALASNGDAWFQWGTAAADVLYGAVGNDYLDGGAGMDIVRYSRAKAGHMVFQSDDGFVLMGPSGVEHLRNVERIDFLDRSVALGTDGNAAIAYRVYQAAFDRKPDAAGLGYWIAQLDKGVSLQDVAGGFIQSPEFALRYGQDSGDAAFVDGLYRNVLHRAGETAGVKFWTNALAAGVARAEVLAAFSEGAENQAQVIGAIQNGIEFAPWLS